MYKLLQACFTQNKMSRRIIFFVIDSLLIMLSLRYVYFAPIKAGIALLTALTDDKLTQTIQLHKRWNKWRCWCHVFSIMFMNKYFFLLYSCFEGEGWSFRSWGNLNHESAACWKKTNLLLTFFLLNLAWELLENGRSKPKVTLLGVIVTADGYLINNNNII